MPTTAIVRAQLDALHAGGVATHLAHVALVEADREAVLRGEHDVVRAARDLHVDQLVALLDLDRLDAGRARVRVLADSAVFFTVPVLRAEQQELVVAELAHRHDRLDLRVRRDVDQVDDRLALRRAAGLRDLVHLEPEAAPVVGEDEQVVVRAADEEPLDEIELLEVLRRSSPRPPRRCRRYVETDVRLM